MAVEFTAVLPISRPTFAKCVRVESRDFTRSEMRVA